MGVDAHCSKASGKASKSENLFKNKQSLVFLALTVLILQVTDYVVIWLADAGSKSSYWSLSNSWTQVDIFVGIFTIFYIGKMVWKKMKDPPCESAAEEPEEEDTSISTVWQAKAPKKAKVPRNKVADTRDSVQKLSGLRADAPEWRSQCTIQNLRAEAPEFVPGGTPDVVRPPASRRSEARTQGVDDDELGKVLFRSEKGEKVLFRSARSATDDAAEKEKVVLKRRETKKAEHKQDYNPWKQDYNPWVKQSQEIEHQQLKTAYDPWAKQSQAATQSKWQPKEKTIWKSSHVVKA